VGLEGLGIKGINQRKNTGNEGPDGKTENHAKRSYRERSCGGTEIKGKRVKDTQRESYGKLEEKKKETIIRASDGRYSRESR